MQFDENGYYIPQQRPTETYAEPDPYELLDLDELWVRPEQSSWLLEPLIPAGGQTVLYSEPKLGKSLLALEIAAGLAEGNRGLLGIVVGDPIHVLYVDHENRPVADIRKRLIDMGYGPDIGSHLHIASFPRASYLDDPQGGAQLLRAAQGCRAALVLIDTVSRTVQGEENSNDTWTAFYRNTGQLLKAAGIALLRLDHCGKDQERGQRGGSAKSSDVDMVWKLKGITPDTLMLICEATRVECNEMTITIKRLRDPLRHKVEGAGFIAALDARAAAMITLLDTTGAPKDLGVVAAQDWLRAAGHKVPSGSISKRMLDARKLGLN